MLFLGKLIFLVKSIYSGKKDPVSKQILKPSLNIFTFTLSRWFFISSKYWVSGNAYWKHLLSLFKLLIVVFLYLHQLGDLINYNTLNVSATYKFEGKSGSFHPIIINSYFLTRDSKISSTSSSVSDENIIVYEVLWLWQ